MGLKVNEKDDLQAKWELETRLHRTIAAGPKAVQDACISGGPTGGAWLLPPGPLERILESGSITDDSRAMYAQRVYLTILLNFYRSTAVYLTGKVFEGSKVKWNLPPGLEYLENDVDGKGESATVFFSRQFLEGITEGVRGCVVTSNKPSGVGVIRQNEAKEKGYRAVFKDVAGMDILGEYNGDVRLSGSKRKSDGGFGWEDVETATVYGPNENVEYVNADGVYLQQPPVAHGAGKAPVEFFAPGSPIGVSSLPPLNDLAWINCDHLRVTSEAAMYRYLCNNPIGHSHRYDLNQAIISRLTVYESGGDAEDGIPFIKWAELTGIIATHNRNELERLERNAALYGLQQLSPKTVPTTAKEHQLVAKGTDSPLSLNAQEFESYAQRCVVLAGKMERIPVTEKVVEVVKEYTMPDVNDLAAIANGVDLRSVSRETHFNTMRSAGIVRTDNTWEIEKQKIKDEGLSDRTEQMFIDVEPND